MESLRWGGVGGNILHVSGDNAPETAILLTIGAISAEVSAEVTECTAEERKPQDIGEDGGVTPKIEEHEITGGTDFMNFVGFTGVVI